MHFTFNDDAEQKHVAERVEAYTSVIHRVLTITIALGMPRTAQTARLCTSLSCTNISWATFEAGKAKRRG